MKLHKKLFGMLALVLACSTAAAVEKPRELSMNTLPGTPDTLRVYARWTAGTVSQPTAPVTYQISWTQNGTVRRVATIAALADTVKFARAPIGSSDVIQFSVNSLYLGRASAPVTTSRTYPNSDNQVPSAPVITAVDTL